MISDHIRYASAYFNLSPGIRMALEFLGNTDVGRLTPGRHDVRGDDVFALVSDYRTRTPADAFWEAHRAFVDVQYVHEGLERIGYGHLAAFAIDSYDEARDLVVARGSSDRFAEVGVGEFVILFPHDVHMPGLTAKSVRSVRKVVVKVKI